MQALPVSLGALLCRQHVAMYRELGGIVEVGDLGLESANFQVQGTIAVSMTLDMCPELAQCKHVQQRHTDDDRLGLSWA